MNLTVPIIVILVLFIGSVAVTLAWWRLADRWAESEHKRFKENPRPEQRDERVVIPPRPSDDA